MYKHILQSLEWGGFKTKFGTKAVLVDGIQYTLHKLPKTKLYYAYCPKVNPKDINWEPLQDSLEENSCFAIKFDVPHVIRGSKEEKEALDIFDSQRNIVKAKKSIFTQNNVVMDISKDETELLANMHQKHRYNIKYALKNGVEVYEDTSENGFEIFYKLIEETGRRQKFLNHPKSYYKEILGLMGSKGIAHLLIAKHQNEPLAAWMLFTYNNVLYYPYGGSTNKNRNLQASNLIGWEAIKLGKANGCNIFDMWGACKDINDTTDPEWGFTNFKLKFGGAYVKYMDSYDLVLNKPIYQAFEVAYPKIIKLLKKLR